MAVGVAGGSRAVWVCAAIAVGVTLAYTVTSMIVRPAMYSDSGWGFFGWYAGQGLPFNVVAKVDPADISRDYTFFGTWWTPGQHVIPGLIERAGLPLGLAIAITVGLFSMLGLAGWYVLYRSFGFPALTSAVAVAIVALTRHFALPFGIYTGGEILLFGTAPWFLTVVWRLRGLSWWAVAPFLVGAAVVVFAKLSGLILSAAAIGAAVLAPSGLWFSRDRLRRGLVAGVTVALIGALFYLLWFSRGVTPVAPKHEFAWSSLLGFLAYAMAGSWGAALSIGDLATWLLVHPSRPLVGSLSMYGLLLPAALATFAFVGYRLRYTYPDYLRFALFLGLAIGGVIVVSSVRGAELGTEERHLRIVSLVLFVGIVQAVLESGRGPRFTFAAVATIVGVYGLSSAVQHAMVNRTHPLGTRGFRHLIADRAALNFLRTIDVATPDRRSTLIYVTSPEIGLEVRNVRVMSNHADFQSVEQLDKLRYRGRVPKLYVVVQQHLTANGKAEKMLRSFVDYPADRWQATPQGRFVGYAER